MSADHFNFRDEVFTDVTHGSTCTSGIIIEPTSLIPPGQVERGTGLMLPAGCFEADSEIVGGDLVADWL